MKDDEMAMLVSTEWLAANLEDADLRVFDCTGCVDENYLNKGRTLHYERHHIPGAAYLDVASPKGELSDPEGLFPFTWPDRGRFESTMARLGVGNNNRVVLYAAPNPLSGDSGTVWATRAWWLMHHFGVRCAVLDGGFRKWQQEGRPVTAGRHDYPPASFGAAEDWERGRRDKQAVLDAISSDEVCLIDALSADSYAGRIDRNYGAFGRRRGHIPTAVNVHYESLEDPDSGCFLPRKRLLELFEVAGVDRARALISYCGGGIGATMVGFALKLIGHESIAIYDASLMEWSNDASLPMVGPDQSH